MSQTRTYLTINDLVRQLVADGKLKPKDMLRFRRLVQRYVNGEVNLLPKMVSANKSDFEKFAKIIITG